MTCGGKAPILARVARRKTDPRARGSGLGAKLRAYFADAQTEWAQRDPDAYMQVKPQNPRQLAEWLTKRGKPVTPTTTGTWANSKNLPESWFVPDLEHLLGGFWYWILDARTTWKRDGTMAVFYRKVRSLTDAELREVAERLDGLVPSSAARAPRR